MVAFSRVTSGRIIRPADINNIQEAVEDLSLTAIPSPTDSAGLPVVAGHDGTSITFGDPGWVNVKLRGVSGDGSDEATAIQAVLDESLFVLFPETATNYAVGSSLTLRSNHSLAGVGFSAPSYNSSPKPQLTARSGFNSPLINAASTTDYVTIRDLGFQGTSGSGSKGIYVASGNRWLIENCVFNNFGDQAIHHVAGVALSLNHLFVDNALLVTTGRADYVGAVQIESQDFRLFDVEVGAPSSAIGDGFRAAILLDGDNGVMLNCIGQLSEAGLVVTGTLNKILANRFDLNKGHGVVVKGSFNSFVSNHSYRNSQDTDNTHDGFRVTGSGAVANTFADNLVANLSGDSKKMRYGFNDDVSGSGTADAGNKYVANHKGNINGALYNITGSSLHGVAGMVGRDFQVGYSGGHNTGHLVIGTTHLWVDATGDLRIKASAPTTDLDGTVVGSQS